MRPLKITCQITTKQISNLVRTEKDGRVRQRLRAMKFISQGQTIPQVARRMDISERPLRKWIHRFNKEGPKGLLDAPRPGQPPKISTKQIEKFNQRIRQSVTDGLVDTYLLDILPQGNKLFLGHTLTEYEFQTG